MRFLAKFEGISQHMILPSSQFDIHVGEYLTITDGEDSILGIWIVKLVSHNIGRVFIDEKWFNSPTVLYLSRE